MAGNSIHGKEQVEEITLVWSKLTKEISNTVNVLEQYQQTTSKLPSEYLNSVNAVKTAQDKQNKATEKAKEVTSLYVAKQKEEIRQAKQLLTAKAKLSKANSQTTKEYHKLNEQKKAIDKLNREEAKRLVETQGLYNKVQKGINNLTKQYNDLAIRKELNGKLSAEETVSLGKLEAKLLKYQKALRNVDANIGKHNRNVGNYKNGFDGLGFSVAQLSREMPAFANSMQTGFMAISNNIPMLVDEVNKLRIANVELASSGKPTVSVLKSLGKAIFGWQTLISIGVTLLTVYGAKIFETIFATSEAEKATEAYNKDLKEQNDALRDNINLRKKQLQGTVNFINDRETVDSFRKALNDLTKDSENTEAVLAELADRLQNIGINDADILKNQEILSSDRLNIAGNLLKIEEESIKLQEERLRIDNVLTQKAEINERFKKGEITLSRKKVLIDQLESASLNKTVSIQKEINRLNKVNQDIIAKTVTIENKDGKDSNREKIKSIEALEESNSSFRIEIEKQIETLQKLQNTLIKGSKDYEYIKKTIDVLKKSLDPFSGLGDAGMKSLSDWSKNFEAQQKEIYRIQKEYAKKRENLERNLSNNIKELGLSVADSIFQSELNKLDKQARINEERAKSALVFANGNAAAEIEIQEQLADKQTQIEEKRIEADRKAFLFNQAFKAGQIAIDTIKAVAALKAQASILLANPATAPLAALALGQIPLVIATGATAGAAVLAQSIPAFWMGTEGGTPGGQIMVNDDPYGIKGNNYKEVIKEPSGKLHFPQGKNVKMNVPKGSTVYPTYTDFNKELDSMLNISGVMPFLSDFMPMTMPNVNINNTGISAQEMDMIIGKHFSSMQTNNTIIDKNGIKTFVSKGHSKTIDMNNRVSQTGYSV